MLFRSEEAVVSPEVEQYILGVDHLVTVLAKTFQYLGLAVGEFLFLIVKEQENQGQAAYDQEADDEGGDGGCVFH